MKKEYSYSTIGFMDRNLFQALDAIAAAGFTQTEILGQEPHLEIDYSSPNLPILMRNLEWNGLRARTVHAPMKRNILGAPSEDWRREAVSNLSRYINCAAALGASELIIHPVPNPIFVSDKNEIDIPKIIHTSVLRSLDTLVRVAEEASVRLLLENLPYECNYPFLSLSELRSLIDTYPIEYVGLVFDVGHAVISGHDTVDEIHSACERLRATHLQDVDGVDDSHWVPGEGIINWNAVNQALIDIEFKGPWTFEVINSRHNETPEQLAHKTKAVAEEWEIEIPDEFSER